MKILILGDVMGLSGRKAIKEKLSKIINDNQIDFTIINGENAPDDGRGITKSIAEEFFLQGIDVITSGNHIWDKQETSDYINKEYREKSAANHIAIIANNQISVTSLARISIPIAISCIVVLLLPTKETIRLFLPVFSIICCLNVEIINSRETIIRAGNTIKGL